MTRHILLAWQEDINIRVNGMEHRVPPEPRSKRTTSRRTVYKDANVAVTAFPNAHGELTRRSATAFRPLTGRS